MKSFLRTNPTEIIDIEAPDIVIRVTRNADFTVARIIIQQIKLDNYRSKLPRNSEIFLIASSAFEEKRIFLGEIEKFVSNREESLSEFATESVFLRLFIVDKNDAQILASCEKPCIIDELHSSKKSLFAIQYLDLGEQLWSLKISEDDNQKPRILIHNNPVLQLKTKIDQKDSLFRIAILPASLESVLFHLALNPVVEPGISSWKKDWRDYCELQGIELPDENINDEYTTEQIEERLKWAKDSSDKVFASIKAVTQLIKYNEENIR